jgi:hypothetical protein
MTIKYSDKPIIFYADVELVNALDEPLPILIKQHFLYE